MRSTSNIINGLLILAVVILYVLHFTPKPPSSDVAVQGSTKSISDTSVSSGSSVSVFINTDTLDANYLYLKDMRDELAVEKLKYESQLSSQLKKLEKEVVEFQEKARFMTQTEGERKQMELAQKEQDLMRMEQELNLKIVESEKERNKKIQKEVSSFLKNFNKQNNYQFIFGYNGWGNVLLADNSLDITNVVIDGLNAEYTLNKSKTEAK